MERATKTLLFSSMHRLEYINIERYLGSHIYVEVSQIKHIAEVNILYIEEKPAETWARFRLASHLVRVPDS